MRIIKRVAVSLLGIPFSDFTVEPSDHVVAIGQPLLLNCQAQYSGPENVVISWKNNADWLLNPDNKPWKQLTNNSLYYSSFPVQSNGTFICGALVTGTQLIIYSRIATVQLACMYNTLFIIHQIFLLVQDWSKHIP